MSKKQETEDRIIPIEEINKKQAEWIANAGKRTEELKTLAEPLVEWLRDNYNPHYEIVISWEFTTIKREDSGVPFPFNWDQ